MNVEAATTAIHQMGGRTFLEVQRFDRPGNFGRSPDCSWAALNHALAGMASKPWTLGAAVLRQNNLIDDDIERDIARVWHFEPLIGNTDMHDGNLAFLPGLRHAPIHDMLPMMYAPIRGVELSERQFAPALPMPAEQTLWEQSARAALAFWKIAAVDERISVGFRRGCVVNVEQVSALIAHFL